VLLEPYGGQVIGLSVAQTTRLTAIMAAGSLVGFGLASRVLGNGAEPLGVAFRGALAGIPGFGIVIVSAALPVPGILQVATLVLGFGAGMFAHGTLTATMRSAPPERVGLALGAWGAVQATAAGIAIAIGGLVRDVIAVQGGAASDAYLPVFAAEIVLLMLAAVFVAPLVRYRTGEQTYKV
jgi:BCD family chlorophyll transporter-like MFS transporter